MKQNFVFKAAKPELRFEKQKNFDLFGPTRTKSNGLKSNFINTYK